MFGNIIAENCMKTRMHSSMMHTARLLTASCSAGGGVCPPTGCRHPWRQTPPWRQTSLDADLPWTEGMTHACENITLPQTSFERGNKGNWTVRGRASLAPLTTRKHSSRIPTAHLPTVMNKFEYVHWGSREGSLYSEAQVGQI